MRIVFGLLIICALCVAYWSFFLLDSDQGVGGTSTPHQSDAAYRVERVIDGDTIRIDYSGKSESVRLIGVDAPEMDDRNEELRALAKRAATFTHQLLAGKSVDLQFDRDRRDKFGRLLAYGYRAPDRLFVNLELVRLGYSRAYTKYPFKYSALFREHERQANSEGLGYGGIPTTDSL